MPVVACIGARRATGGCSTSTPTRSPGIWRRGSARARLVIAGTTPGVLDEAARRCRCSTPAAVDAAGRATAPRRPAWSPSCGPASTRSASGVDDVVIVDGRDGRRSKRAAVGASATGGGDADWCAADRRRYAGRSSQTGHDDGDWTTSSGARGAPRPADLPAAAGHVRARPGRAPVRRRGTRVSRPAVGHRRRVARPRAPRPRARDRGPGARR